MFSNKILQGIITSDHYELSLRNVRNIKKFGAEQFDYIVKFKNIPNEFVSSMVMLEKVIKSIVKEILVNTMPMDTVKIFLEHEILKDSVQFKFKKASEISGDYIVECLTKLAQSGKDLLAMSSYFKYISFDTLEDIQNSLLPKNY